MTKIRVWNACVSLTEENGERSFSHRVDNPINRADAVTVAMLLSDIISDSGLEVDLKYFN